METRASYAAVGAFVLTLFAGILTFTLWMSKPRHDKGVLYDIFLIGSASGLRESDPVTYNGVPIGAIRKIHIEPQDLKHIHIIVRIKNPSLIREGATATLEPKGITGQSELQIRGSDSSRPVLRAKPGEKRPRVEFQPSPFQQVLENTPHILEDIASLVEGMRPLFNAENRRYVSHILENMDKFTAALEKESPKIAAFFTRADQSFDAFTKTMHGFDRLLQENQAPLKTFTEGGLPEFTRLVTDLRTLTRNLNRIAEKFERNPSPFFFESSEGGKTIE